jgi:protein SCO1
MTRGEMIRSPWVWGFLIGIVTLTLLRPILRYIPDPPPVSGQVPEFTLVDEKGEAFGSKELRGQIYIASFFSTGCSSSCPAVMKGMKRLQDAFVRREINGIRLASISVDPEHDTPEVLRAYAKELGADPARWTFLTGDPAAIRAVVVDGFKASPEPVGLAHSERVVLVDAQGGIRGSYGTDEMGLDEVYNRAQHVQRQQRALLK